MQVRGLQLGLQTFCHNCLSFVSGPPKCSECGAKISQNCAYFKIAPADSEEQANVIKFQPRTVKDRLLTFCPLCGFTSEDPNVCSLCKQQFPTYCSIIPVDGVAKLPSNLNFVKVQDDNDKCQNENEDESCTAELIKIFNWKEAVELQEDNQAQKWLESIPFAVTLDTVYDHQLSCFPDEIFELSDAVRCQSNP
jgi:hypothetical protein